MSELLWRDKSTISCQIKNVFAEGELTKEAAAAKFAAARSEGARQGKNL